MFLIPLAISLVISLYGYFEALNIRTEEIVIKTKKLPPEIGTLTIANIADVHIGLIVRQEQLRRILAQVKAANPDMLVSSGDLVDGQLDGLNGLSEMLRDINPRFGKYAITGNHEFLAGFEQALDFIERSGFRVIRADAITVAGVISLAGVDDPTGKRYSRFKEISERDLLSGLPKNTFVILLKHRPLVDNNALGLFDLQLSAHTHKGQLFPFSIITYLYYPVHAGLAELPSGSYLHVSRGAGTWGPPIRFLTPPEVTIIKLVSD
jgi:predicted MPP superfamily phosphohydrolase